VSPERPEQDDFLEDEEQEEYGQRSIFATGWFRAVLVLLVLAVIAVIAVPLIGGWFEPTPPPKVVTRPSEPAPSMAPTPAPTAPAPSAPAPPPASQMPSASAPPAAPPPTAAPAPTVQPSPPPAASAPAPARPEMPAATPPKAAEKAKPPERTAAVTPGKSATKAASGSYWVQVGAFKESRNAEGLAQKLRSEGYPVQVTRVTRDEPLHVVRVGGFPDRARASAAREELQGKGQTGFVTAGPAK
jgi:outer membrane biosynthesis protein TonB